MIDLHGLLLIQMLHTKKNVKESGLKFSRNSKSKGIRVDGMPLRKVLKVFLCCSDYGHEMAFLQPLPGKKSPPPLSVNNKE